MFLSFIVPVFNTEKYIAECLESLLTQDIPAYDYEIICINDGSQDNSLEILKSFSKRYSNIKIIDIANRGVSNARNIGIENAIGEYIWMVDSDDFIPHNILSDIKNYVLEKQLDILDFGAYTFTEQLSDSEKELFLQNKLIPNSFANHVFITKSIFKLSFIKENSIRFDINIAYSEDSLFKCECLLKNPKIQLVKKTYYLIRYRSGSATALKSQKYLKKKFDSFKCSSNKFKEYYEICTPSLKPQMADLTMSNLWSALSILAEMPLKKISAQLKVLKGEGLFPFERPKECSVNRSYLTNRTDIIGKIFDKIYIHSHTYTGFLLMCVWSKIYKIYTQNFKKDLI